MWRVNTVMKLSLFQAMAVSWSSPVFQCTWFSFIGRRNRNQSNVLLVRAHMLCCAQQRTLSYGHSGFVSVLITSPHNLSLPLKSEKDENIFFILHSFLFSLTPCFSCAFNPFPILCQIPFDVIFLYKSTVGTVLPPNLQDHHHYIRIVYWALYLCSLDPVEHGTGWNRLPYNSPMESGKSYTKGKGFSFWSNQLNFY
jgi:hypothetical protein